MGYTIGSLLLFVGLAITLLIWHRKYKNIEVVTITESNKEILFWVAVLFSNSLGTAFGDYLSDVGGPWGQLTIGKCDGFPSPVQRKVAAYVRTVQSHSDLAGRTICVTLNDYNAVFAEHYARFAVARGWPPEEGGEAARVNEERWASGI